MRRRRMPMAACVALVACVNAVCWSLVTPPFQVTDETAHFAYVKQLAETGDLPSGTAGEIPEEEAVVLSDLRYFQLREEPASLALVSSGEQQRLQRDAERVARLPRHGSRFAGVASSEPPLYYALESIPYRLAYHSTILVRLQLMRLLSALMAGFTALFVYLFAREALPGAPWAWRVAGLSVALTPVLGMLSGAVNPESMLYAVSAALFYLLARGFRRGLTMRLAGAIGVILGVGLLTKVNFIGLLPGAGLGVLLLSMRLSRSSRKEALRCVAVLGGVMIVLLLSAAAIGALRLHTVGQEASDNISGLGHHGSLLDELQFMWQLYLPPLPGMHSDFPGIFAPLQIWFDGFIGMVGSSDVNVAFPPWVYQLALLPAAAIAALCARAMLQRRITLRKRAGELLVYVVMALGVMALIAAVSYGRFPQAGGEFGRTRYLFPMLALLGAVLALAARGAGRRWGPAVGVLIVLMMLSHDIFSQLLVVARYYG